MPAAKFIVALVGAFFELALIWPTGEPEWLPGAIAFATALGVYAKRNAARSSEDSQDW